MASLGAQSGFHLFTGLLPLEMASMGVDVRYIGIAVGVGGFAQVPAALIMGWLTGVAGVALLLRLAIMLYALGALLVAGALVIVPDHVVPLAIGARTLQGLGYGLMVPASLTWIAASSTPADRSRAIGLGASAMHLAFIVFPPIGMLLGGTLSVAAVVVMCEILMLISATLVGTRRTSVGFRSGPHGQAYTTAMPSPVRLYLAMGLQLAFQGVLFTRIPVYAGPDATAHFFLFMGAGVVSGRLIVGRKGAESGSWLIAGTASSILGLLALRQLPEVPGLALSGLLIGAASGVMMQILTVWLTNVPPELHASRLSRFSASMAIGLGVGGIASPRLPAMSPLRDPAPILTLVAVAATCIALAGRPVTRTSNRNPRQGVP